jgi:hypothetical protein
MKWLNFMQADMVEAKLEGLNILSAMEQTDGEASDSNRETEGRLVLSTEVVKQIVATREQEDGMKCDNGKDSKHMWGPTVVERHRRKTNTGEYMMQKAMNLKKKKNLGSMIGNRFAPLQIESLNLLSKDVNIKIGNDVNEEEGIIRKLVDEEHIKYDEFVGENPEVLLPANIDIDLGIVNSPLKGQDDVIVASPNTSIKEANSSELWIEVVRKGKNRAKAKSKGDKISQHDRCFLEY